MVLKMWLFVCLWLFGSGLTLITASADESKAAARPRVPPPVTPSPKPKPKRSASPTVYTPAPVSPPRVVPGRFFPWKRNITATIFWIGEEPTAKNPTPNHMSSWDRNWEANYGGYDDPNPLARSRDFRPRSFTPKLNSFYVALPYNDVDRNGTKAEARRVVPWFDKRYQRPGHTTLKGQWLAIKYKGKYCFAQWEDCGPYITDDWQYVFGNARPRNLENKGAGIDLSPAVRDFLKLKSGDTVDWKFVSESEVRRGPWHYYGGKSNVSGSRRPTQTPKPQPTIEELYEQRLRATSRKLSSRSSYGN